MNGTGMSLGGLLAAALGLIALQVITTSSDATGIISLVQVPARLAQAWMDPGVALVPDRSSSTTSASPAPAGSGAQQPGATYSQIIDRTK